MSLRGQFVVALVAFSVVLTAVGGWGTWRIVSRDLEAEMDDKLRQVAGVAAKVGFESSGLETLQPGDEDLSLYTRHHSRLRQLETYVAEAWLIRTADFTALMSSRPAREVPIGSSTQFEAYSDEIRRAEAQNIATTSPLVPGPGDRPYKYGFVGLVSNPGIVLVVQMSAGYLRPVKLLRDRILLGSVLAALVAILIALSLSRNVARPLERLSRVAHRIQRGHWAEPVEREPGHELGRLSGAMESMRQGIIRRDEHVKLMLAQVAHEIRNPLGGLELFASAAAEAESSEERERLLKRVRDEVQTLNQIINNFLAFAKPLDPEIGLHDIREPIREAAELVALEMNEHCCLDTDLPDEPLLARADPSHVKQVALNLLRNAAQAGEHVELKCDVFRGEVRMIVKDDGPGIPESLRERVFEPFVTDKEQGAGLGLAIVQKLVTANRGRVELLVEDGDSVGSGTEFRVYFTGSEELPLPALSTAG